jgi:hypothetical protein
MEDLEIFDDARKLYPGTKRGCSTEFDDFRKHSDWKIALNLLKPAIENQILWRKLAKGEFRPAWKNFKVWIHQRCWEEHHDVKQPVERQVETYVLPRPDHVLTLEERQALKAKLMQSDAKTKALFKYHTPDTTKKVMLPTQMSEINHTTSGHKMTVSEQKDKLGQAIIDIFKYKRECGGKR